VHSPGNNLVAIQHDVSRKQSKLNNSSTYKQGSLVATIRGSQTVKDSLLLPSEHQDDTTP